MGRAGDALDAEFVTPIGTPGPDSHAEASMEQMMPMLAAAMAPLLLVAVWLSWWIRRDVRRTPRAFKLAARQRQPLERQRRRDANSRRGWMMRQHFGRLLRLLRREPRPRSRSR